MAMSERARQEHDELLPGHVLTLLSADCFGDNHTRIGVDVKTRELLTFAMLVSLGGCDPQVRGHVSANLRVGNDRGRLLDVLAQLLPFIRHPRTLNGLAAVNAAAPAPKEVAQ